jgi:hypothetical protein
VYVGCNRSGKHLFWAVVLTRCSCVHYLCKESCLESTGKWSSNKISSVASSAFLKQAVQSHTPRGLREEGWATVYFAFQTSWNWVQ